MKIKDINRLVESILNRPVDSYLNETVFKIEGRAYGWYIFNDTFPRLIIYHTYRDPQVISETVRFAYKISKEQYDLLKEKKDEIFEYQERIMFNDLTSE